MAWRFVVFDETFREAELTLGEAIKVEDLMSYVDAKGVAVRPNWEAIHPTRSAKAAVCIAAVMYAGRHEIAVDEAMTKVGELKMVDFIEDIDLKDSDDLPTVIEDGFPQSADEPSTTS